MKPGELLKGKIYYKDKPRMFESYIIYKNKLTGILCLPGIRLVIKTLSFFTFKWNFPTWSRDSVDLMLVRASN